MQSKRPRCAKRGRGRGAKGAERCKNPGQRNAFSAALQNKQRQALAARAAEAQLASETAQAELASLQGAASRGDHTAP